MSYYLYYCKRCNTLAVDDVPASELICEECGQKYYPLRVTEEQWDQLDNQGKRDVLQRATMPQINKPVGEKPVNQKPTANNNVRNNSQRNRQLTPPNNDGKISGLSITGFVMSIIGCLSFVGLILGIIDLTKNDGRKKGLSIAAVVISALWILIAIIGGTTSSGSSSSKVESSNRKTKTETQTEVDTGADLENLDTSEETKTEVVNEKEEEPDETLLFTLGQQNAIKSALRYLKSSAFSRAGLINQLSSEYGDNYPIEEATFAIEYIENKELVDWKEQATLAAQNYIKHSAFSKLGLIGQLSSEYGDQYTEEEAVYGVQFLEDNNLVDWKEQAVKSAQSYLSHSSFSRNELKDQLMSEYGEKYSEEEAEYAVTAVGY